MSERFYSSRQIEGECVTLEGSEAHHLLHVMRADVGDAVTLFDGSGYEFEAKVERLGRANVTVRIAVRHDVDRELPLTIEIGVALPKGDRQKWLVEKLTELGAATLVPLETERGVAQPTSGAIDRLRRTVIEAAKQCGRNRLMEITEPRRWSDWLASPHGDSEMARFVAHPGGVSMRSVDRGNQLSVQLAVGPEGGFTPVELEEAIEAGWQKIDLGRRILRVETAAVALAAAFAL